LRTNNLCILKSLVHANCAPQLSVPKQNSFKLEFFEAGIINNNQLILEVLIRAIPQLTERNQLM